MILLSSRLNALFLAGGVFALDQSTKSLVLQMAAVGGLPLRLTGFLNVILSGNLGVSFGLFHAQTQLGVFLLLGVGVILTAILGYWLWTTQQKVTLYALGAMLGGALGNILDRYQFGKVVDFIDFHILGYHWYTFNVADCGIVVGAFLYGVNEFYQSTKGEK